MSKSFNHQNCFSHEDVIRKSKKKTYDKNDRKKGKNKLYEFYNKLDSSDSFSDYYDEYDDFSDELLSESTTNYPKG